MIKPKTESKRCPSKWKWKPSQRAMTCDDTDEGRLDHGVNESTGLRCACRSCDWPSCPPACGVMKGAHQHERAKGARWGGWAHRTGVGVAVGVPSPPPGDYTWHDSTGSKVTHGATTHARGDRHLAQSSSGPQDGRTSWWARARAPHVVTGWLTHPGPAVWA